MARLTDSEVKSRLAAVGVELVGAYQGVGVRVDMRCDRGHTFTAAPRGFFNGHGCPECYSESRRLNTDEVKARLTPRGIYLVNDEYSGDSSHKAEFKCCHGHTWITTYSSVLGGHGCPTCKRDNDRLAPDTIRARIKAKGLTLLSENYQNSAADLLLQCDAHQHHKFSTSLKNVVACKGCPYCSGHKLHPEDLKTKLQLRGITLLTDYQSINEKGIFRCSEGHEWRSKINYVLHKVGCPHCRRITLHMQNRTPDLIAPETAINAIRISIRAAAGGDIDLDELHAADAVIRDFIAEQGLTRYKGLREEVAMSARALTERHAAELPPAAPAEPAPKVAAPPPPAPQVTDEPSPGERKRRKRTKKDLINDRLSRRGISIVNEPPHCYRHKALFMCRRNHKWRALVSSVLYYDETCPTCEEFEKKVKTPRVFPKTKPPTEQLLWVDEESQPKKEPLKWGYDLKPQRKSKAKQISPEIRRIAGGPRIKPMDQPADFVWNPHKLR